MGARVAQQLLHSTRPQPRQWWRRFSTLKSDRHCDGSRHGAAARAAPSEVSACGGGATWAATTGGAYVEAADGALVGLPKGSALFAEPGHFGQGRHLGGRPPLAQALTHRAQVPRRSSRHGAAPVGAAAGGALALAAAVLVAPRRVDLHQLMLGLGVAPAAPRLSGPRPRPSAPAFPTAGR